MRRLGTVFLLAAAFLLAGCQASIVSGSSPLPGLSFSSTVLNFGSTAVGNTVALDVTITNSRSAAVTLVQGAVTGSGFTTTGVGSGLTLEPNNSATLQVQFRPTTSGKATGSVALSVSEAQVPVLIKMSGQGVTSAHSVSLNWSPEAGVVGYNVYRRSSEAAPWAKLIASPDIVSSYIDIAVMAGQPYSYAVSAIGNDGVESSLSEIVSVTIPSP